LMSDLSLPRAANLSAASAQTAFLLCAATLLCAVFLQKIALPGTDGLFPLNLFIFPALTLLAFVFGVIEINAPAFACYALLILAGAVSAAISPSNHVSALSLGFLLVVQFPLAFRLIHSEFPYRRLFHAELSAWGESPMWWKILIVVLLLQIPLGILVGRFIKLGNPSNERQTIWTKRARERIGRLTRRFTGS
jgi:hypothetical protein